MSSRSPPAPQASAPTAPTTEIEEPKVKPPICDGIRYDNLAPWLELPALANDAQPSRANLTTWVKALAGPELRGREAGTHDAQRAAELIAKYVSATGASAPDDKGFCRSFSAEGVTDRNVVAHVASGKSCGSVIVGAHYDALGVDDEGRVRPGADDNASGVSLLLELARLVRAKAVRHELDLVLIAFGAEEKGLLGSQAYVAKPSVPLSEVRLMLNIDMVGRKPKGYPVIGYEASGRERGRNALRVKNAAKSANVDAVAMSLGDRGDNASFSPHVPTLFLCTTVHEDYHQPTDTPERVDYEQTERALRLVIALVEAMECDALPPPP
jgi:hypothetical protein